MIILLYHFQNWWKFNLECKHDKHKTVFRTRTVTGTLKKGPPGVDNRLLILNLEIYLLTSNIITRGNSNYKDRYILYSFKNTINFYLLVIHEKINFLYVYVYAYCTELIECCKWQWLLKYVSSQEAQPRNMSIGEHRHCCVTFEI